MPLTQPQPGSLHSRAVGHLLEKVAADVIGSAYTRPTMASLLGYILGSLDYVTWQRPRELAGKVTNLSPRENDIALPQGEVSRVDVLRQGPIHRRLDLPLGASL